MKRVLLTQIIAARAFLLLGVLTVVLYITAVSTFHEKVRFQAHVSKDDSQNNTLIKSKGPLDFWSRCKQNESAADIAGFNLLPKDLQTFLYYRHCRHFPILLNVPDKCGGAKRSSEVFLLLVIKSSPENYDRREVLRKTWAEERLHNGVWIRRLFISGVMGDGFRRERLNKVLKLEQREYSDILQWDFNDSFYNLTLKQILFLHWMERNCPHVRFLLNGDDDVFANTGNMVEYLQSLKKNDGSKHLFAGHLILNASPIRTPHSKYYIPTQVQEESAYPPYCGGGGIILSGYTASLIYHMSHAIPLLPIDDVYLAQCLAKAGLSPTSHMGVLTGGLFVPSKKRDPYDPCIYRDLLLVHRFLSAELYLLWHRVNDPSLKCSSRSNTDIA